MKEFSGETGVMACDLFMGLMGLMGLIGFIGTDACSRKTSFGKITGAGAVVRAPDH